MTSGGSSMVDTPGGWELQRAHDQLRKDVRDGFTGLHARLDKLVSTDAFVAEQRRVDDRLKDLADDIAHERTARTAEISTERAARQAGDTDQQKAIDKLVTTLRWVMASIVIPIALFVATLLMSARGS